MQPQQTTAVGIYKARQAEAAEQVEARLDYWLSSRTSTGAPPRLTAAMQHATLGGGKRFRAFLVLEGARLLAAPAAAALDVAAALECVHAYSLVHDDLPAMDDDTLRRGQPTVWKAFDEWTAILAGDGLQTLAFEILAAIEDISAEAKVRLISRLAKDAGRIGMVGGQMLDLEAEKLGLPAMPTREHIARLQAMKTGALIQFACDAGGLLTTSSPAHRDGQHAAQREAQREAMSRYGRALGLAFQISDDLLDAEGDATVVGKAVGKDAALGKATLTSLSGIPTAKLQLAEVVQMAVDALSGFSTAADGLREAAQFMSQRQK